jgi:nicotinamide mononucleotide adenylyltransferase
MSTQLEPNNISIYYFIGRLNPPHNGHIAALIQLVDTAKKNGNSVPLILLGNGPKVGNPLDNPIRFDLKKKFIDLNLSKRGFTEGTDYVIKEMTNPATNVSEYVSEYLNRHPQHFNTINIIHVAGGKDEDASKLDFIKKFAFTAAYDAKPDTETISVLTEAVEPVTVGSQEMSATRVRKDAYKNFLNGKGLEGFLLEKDGLYSQFYGPMAQDIYNAIISVAQNVGQMNVQEYLDPSVKLPKTKKARTRGGRIRNTRSKRNTRNRRNRRCKIYSRSKRR